MGKKMESDYSEELVGYTIESYLTLLSFPFSKFSVEPFSNSRERKLGIDGRIISDIKSFKPFYMQFKKPSAYPKDSTSPIITNRKNVSPTPLRVDPITLFFKLRDKQPKHRDFQHNVLYRLRDRLKKWAQSDATYVCPLILDRASYHQKAHIAGLLRLWRRPWFYKNVLIYDIRHSKEIPFSRIPALGAHVSIPPHDLVTSANHKYSFTQDGSELCFHSPLSLPNGTQTLGEWLSGMSEGVLTEDATIPSEESLDVLRHVIYGQKDEVPLPAPEDLLQEEDGVTAWLKWGEYLKKEYGIEQYAFIVWKNEENSEDNALFS